MEENTSKTKLSSQDALRLAAADKVFAKALIENPQAFTQVFNLKPKEVEEINNTRLKMASGQQKEIASY